MNSNSLSSGPASIPDFSPLSDAFDMTPTPSEADAMSVRATVSWQKNLPYDVKLNPKLPLCRLEQFQLSIKKWLVLHQLHLAIGLKKLVPLFHPIRSWTKTNIIVTCSHTFPRTLRSQLCDWLEWQLWFWLYDTQLKTTLKAQTNQNTTFNLSTNGKCSKNQMF